MILDCDKGGEAKRTENFVDDVEGPGSEDHGGDPENTKGKKQASASLMRQRVGMECRTCRTSCRIQPLSCGSPRRPTGMPARP